MPSKDYRVNKKMFSEILKTKEEKSGTLQDEFRISTYNLFNYQCQLQKMLPSESE